MSMVIVIPTRRRLATQKTWDHLPKRWRERTRFVVDETDAKQFRFHSETDGDRFWGCTVVVHPEEVQTIAQKRAWIMRTMDAPKFLMLDDDLLFSQRVLGTERLEKIRGEEVGVWLDKMEAKLDEVAHAGFGPRQNANTKTTEWDVNSRMVYALGYRTEVAQTLDFGPAGYGRIETREDFDYTLQLLKRGFPNAVCNYCVVDQIYNAKGGCSEERTMERSNADALRLAELHPGLVRVAERAYKSSGAGTAAATRMEVTIQWKKAFQQGEAE